MTTPDAPRSSPSNAEPSDWTNERLHEYITSARGIDPQTDVLALAEEVRAWREESAERALKLTAPTVIYHYCRVEAFESIVRGGEVWLADGTATNDKVENEYWSAVVDSILREELDQEEAARQLGWLRLSRARLRIARFSTKGDLLSQWRAYADDGRGFSIGVRVEMLGLGYRQVPAGWNPQPASLVFERQRSLMPMVYERGAQEACIRAACAEFKQARQRAAREHPEELRIAKTKLFLDLHYWSLMFKHPSFEEESEVRIVDGDRIEMTATGITRSTESVRLKLTPFGARRFVPFALSNSTSSSPIVEVLRGPRNVIDESSLRELFEEAKLADIELTSSRVPYR